MNILMVCLGNICRSPLAEGILQSKISPNHLVESAGTAGYHIGDLPDIRSIEVAKNHGINITHQRCRKFIVEDFDRFDKIFVMDHSNYENVVRLARNEAEKEKVELILQYGDEKREEVPDPYYGEEDGFEYVYQLLNNATDAICSEYDLK